MSEDKNASRQFKFVFIPADTAEPLEERTLSYTEEKEVESLLDHCKAHFATSGPVKTAAQRQKQRQELLSKLPAGSTVPDSVLDLATSLSTVDNIALLVNSRENGYTGINMYVDDEGAIKELPTNHRASDIAQCCGKPMTVRGDAFIARVFDNEDHFERKDFTLGEVSSSAPWVKAAHEQNKGRQRGKSGAAAMVERMQAQRGHSSPAAAAKDAGNAAFQQAKYQEAEGHYSRALQLDGGMTAALNNRALALLKQSKAAEAEADLTTVLEREPRNIKALLRRGTARESLGKIAEAAQDYRRAGELEPQNKEAAAKAAELADRLAKGPSSSGPAAGGRGAPAGLA